MRTEQVFHRDRERWVIPHVRFWGRIKGKPSAGTRQVFLRSEAARERHVADKVQGGGGDVFIVGSVCVWVCAWMFFTGRTASIMCGKMLEVSVIDGSCRVWWILGEINVAIFLSLATLTFTLSLSLTLSSLFFPVPRSLLFSVKLNSFDWQEVQFLECKPEHARICHTLVKMQTPHGSV